MRSVAIDDIAAIARLDVVPMILEVICRSTGLGFSAIARVTEDRWIACAVRDEIAFGLEPGGELPIETTICNEIRRCGERVVIDHVDHDDLFRDHATPKLYGFQSYISVPIRLSDGRFFGTLCAIDPRPARLNNRETIGMFELFANLIALHLDAQRRLNVSETALATERHRTELQDQFIAVLGHDLRSPLLAIRMAATSLSALELSERAARAAAVIDPSAQRMEGLIDNILDFARARLGGGIPIVRTADPGLQGTLEQVVTEMRTAHPARAIHAEINVTCPVRCDRNRLGQLLSNLLANALSHGVPDGPVSLYARTLDDQFELRVINQGEPIPPATIARLFQPFARGLGLHGGDGLGLGLYIASEIAIAHDGSLDVASSGGETRFTFLMPLI